ncbi:MAG: hypothetical protein V2I33_07465 [Kangiellaceae bacterium]|jgi:hypothetical protein|nr:hypothetical protein [Kangiellaceae bacterium]
MSATTGKHSELIMEIDLSAPDPLDEPSEPKQQKAPEQPEPADQTVSRSNGAKRAVWPALLIGMVVGVTATLGIQYLPPMFDQQPVQKVKTKKVTYYQWTDEQGEMIISRNKPNNAAIEYISFIATEELESYEYNIDSELLAIAEEYHNSLNKDGKSSYNLDDALSSSTYGSNSIKKVKKCVQLISQLRQRQNQMIYGSSSSSRGQPSVQQLQQQVSQTCSQ